MNETTSEATTEFVWRRLEEPFKLFGLTGAPAWWLFLLAIVLAVGLFYIGWMYLRDSKAIGLPTALLLGLLRAAVYALIALVFLMPATQTWHEKRERSKVIVLFDTSLSMGARDEMPGPGQSFDSVPTRMDKIMAFLQDEQIKFIPRLEEKNPTTLYRFARGLDQDYLHFESGKVWSRPEREKLLAAQSRREELPEGIRLAPEHWNSFLTPVTKDDLPAGWKDEDARGMELLRRIRENQAKVTVGFFNATAIGESVLDVIKQERNNMVEGIIVFTDGRLTEGSLSSVKEAALAARDAEIPIFVVGIGDALPKVSIDIVDISAPPLIRPEDKFRVVLTVNGYDMKEGDTFDVFLDVTRIKRKPDSKEVEELMIEGIELDEKGQVLADKRFNLKKKITLTVKDAKEKPVFKQGNPPTCQVEFEIDAAKLCQAAGVSLEGRKVGLAPDDNSEIRFVARIPKDKREIFDKPEHVSEAADMRVEEKALRVLLVSSAASKEFQFVTNLLVREETKNRAKVCINLQPVPGSDKGNRENIVLGVDPKQMLDSFPVKRSVQGGSETSPYLCMESYDVVVTFDADWSQLSLEQARMLSKWVYEKGGGLIFIGGPMNTKEAASPIWQPKSGEDAREPKNPYHAVTQMLPVILEFSDKEIATTDIPRRLTFPQATGSMEYMRLDETLPQSQWKKAWDKFFNEIQDEDGSTHEVEAAAVPERGFYTYYPTKKVKDNALRIAAIDSPTALMAGSPEKQPYLASGPWGQGKVFWIASQETWRLRMYKEQYHERFWTKILREAGSRSSNTLAKRITPIMSRHGTVNKYQPFEARFEDINGQPLRRLIKPQPKLYVTPPEGVLPEKDNTVLIKDGEHKGKEAKVLEVLKPSEKTGATVRKLKLSVFLDKERKSVVPQPVEIESNKVEIVYEPLLFKPKLGEKPDQTLDRNNDGWFKVEFQPTAAGEYKLKVAYEDSPDNFYNHKFIVRESNPEKDNVKPDPEVLWELATAARPVLARMEKADRKAEVRAILKKPEGLDKEKDRDRGKKPAADGSGDDGMRLYFPNLKAAELIPDCMTTRKKDIRNRGKIDDLWDDGLIEIESENGDKKPLLPWVLLIATGLLSIEWLTRKLLRLA